MRRFYRWGFILFSIGMFFTKQGWASSPPGQPVLQVLDGNLNQLQTDSLVIVQDSAFFFLSGSLSSTNYPVINNVTFKINESSLQYLQSSFTASVRLHITSTLFDNSTVSTDTTLTINYRSDSLYTSRSTYQFKNAYKVQVKVLSVSTNVAWNVWKSLVVEDQLQSFPSFSFSCSAQAIQAVSHGSLPFATNADELPVSWGNVFQADAYDLEWTYIDSVALIDPANYYTSGVPDPQKIFENSTSRVTITSNQYNIPLLYDGSGTLFFRVRPIQNKSNGLRVGAQWSSDFSGGLGSFAFYGHQRNLNWQSTVSYAEEGKRKMVVQYYDGSLRSRQTVTKDNTTGTTVIAESIYDYQGRPVLQVLPAPTINNIIGYSQNFNLGVNGSVSYDQTNFDTMIDSSYYCSARANPMDTTSGAGRYYSPNNPLRDTGYNKFIPDSKGFPFTETSYTQDNTGRMRSQGGVGPNHQLTTGHETNYFYGTPDQKELDALFGTEAGDHSHYFKTMVKDANGQYSVSYADMHGRTVATALAGLLVDSIKLDSLKERFRVSQTETIADSTTSINKDLVMESKKSLLVSMAGYHTFTYNLNSRTLQKPDCLGVNVNYDAIYDLEIIITDDCNNQKMLGGHAFDTLIHSSSFNFSFTKWLPEGNYEITKRLIVSRSDLNYYRDSVYNKKNLCKTLGSVIQTQKNIIAGVSQCVPNCQSCKDSLGTFATFQPKYMTRAGIAISDTASYLSNALAAFAQAQSDCSLLCDSVSEVDSYLSNMLLDMTPPSGQYANPDNASDIYSVFHITVDGNGTTTSAAPYSLVTGYVDGEGKLDTVYDETNGTLVTPENLSPEAFSAKFKLSWAQTLLPGHPEYCKLQQHLSYSASAKWNKRFESTDSYSAALAKGYLNPPGITGAQYTRFNGTTPDRDPLPGIMGGSMPAIFQADVKTTAGGMFLNYTTKQNLWTLASNPIKYGPTKSNTTGNINIDSTFTTGMCAGDLDMAWRNFREIYLNIKNHLTDSMLNSVLCTSSVKSGILIAAGHQPNFSDAQQAVVNYGMYVPTTLTGADTTTAKNNANAALAGSYGSVCSSYATYWWQQLNACGRYSVADSAAIIPQLIQVCQKGSNITHPMGSSSISPDSSNSFKSFQEVIAAYNLAHIPQILDTNFKCNAYSITSPKPYSAQSAYSNQPLYGQPDTCTCNKLAVLYRQFQAKQATYSFSFSTYLAQVYGTTMSVTDLNTLLSSCNLTSAPSCTYSSAAIQLPPLLQCSTGDVCITCAQYKTNFDKFKTVYPGVSVALDSLSTDTAQITKNQLFAAYMNNQFGFVKSSNDYLQFASSCSSRIAQDSINLTKDTCKRYTFIKNYGGSGTEYFADVRQTTDGGYVLAGYSTSFGNGSQDGYVVKTDNRGNITWSKVYGGAQNETFSKIRQTTDGGYIAVGTTKSYHQVKGEIFVVKIKPNGDVAWSKGFTQNSTNGEVGNDIVQTSDKGYAIVGMWNYAAGVAKFEVINTDSNGNVIWGETFGSTSSNNLGGIVERSDTLFMAGFVYSSAVTKLAGGNPLGTSYDAFLTKINRSNGSLVWIKSYDIASKSNWVFGITASPNGYRLNTFNSDDFSNANPKQLAFEVDRSGNSIRATQMTAQTNNIAITTLAPTFDGGYVLSQSYTDATFGDHFLHKVDGSGNISWSNRISRTGIQYLGQLIQSSDSSFVGAGLDGSHGLMIKTSRWGKSYCSDATPSNTGTSLVVTTFPLTMGTTTLTFSSPSITVVATNVQSTQTDVCDYDPCTVAGGYGPTLCGRSAPILPSIAIDSISNCSDSTFFAVSTGTEIYNYYRDSISNTFDSLYRSFAMNAYKYEKFTVLHQKSEYHYTLYYYDQAGNLLKTIPPAGIDMSKFGWDQAWSDSVTAARKNNQLLVPIHWLFTNYRYNSLNQVVKQKTPDGGTSQFWYDRLGRLSISQNLKQYSASATENGRQYSYTLYDVLGRITEVGQINNAGSTAMTDTISRRQSLMDSWIAASVAGKEQITQTVYDLPYAGFVGVSPQPTTQRNLRNRVSYTSFATGAIPANYDQASFYTYDIEGNVDTLLQDYGSSETNANVMNVNNNRWKKTVYQFDLISGKVNTVAYQAGKPDQFYHRYSYDGENRLILAESSSDSVIWEKEARYQYYKHGPLARMVIGDQQVQGLDYAYTLQGWLKGVNSTNLAIGYDMGRDGDTTYLNRYVARDAFGFNLGYYTGDYTAISPAAISFPSPVAYIGVNYDKKLYNGNISSMAVNIGKFNNPLLYLYSYDQLNRLTGMRVDSGFSRVIANSWQGLDTLMQDYQERVAYDQNGNITQYLRKGTNTVNLNMDSLSYFYNRDAGGRLVNNQLNYIRDEIGGSAAHSGNYPNDIDDQSANNYSYDSIGNLTKDNAEGITNINWSVYGKILRIQKTASGSNPTTDMQYTYDAAGNRISKKVTDNAGSIAYTWYSRDAQGNVMSTYTSAGSGTMDSTHYTLTLTEQHIYGSSRLGILTRNQTMKGAFSFPSIVTFQRGLKNYELSNHLGNVLVTISDKKTGFSTNGTTIDNFTADVRNATDYYPFGMQMPGRAYVASNNYRYGFNGKENDNEVKGIGNQVDFGERIFDPRIGKWLSLDPLMNKYPFASPYQFSLNTPIQAKDPDGRLVIFINGLWGFGTGASGGGTKDYWSYSNGSGDWADEAMNKIGDHSARYYDGSSGGFWMGNPQREALISQRIAQGYKVGKVDAAEIISNLKRDPNDPNKIVESVKFVTNSMGAAYERGFSAALKEYVDKYNSDVNKHNSKEMIKAAHDPNYKMNMQKPLTGFEIESNVDLAAFQGSDIPADPNAKSNYFMRSKKDHVAGFEGSKVKNSKEIGLDENGNQKSTGHHASHFPASDLPASNKNSDQKKDINQSN
jgi:RHS repeat-associated protein